MDEYGGFLSWGDECCGWVDDCPDAGDIDTSE